MVLCMYGEYAPRNGCKCSNCEGVKALTAEITALSEWKESAIAVMPPMQEIGREIGVKWGDSVHDKILPWIPLKMKRVDELNSEFPCIACGGTLYHYLSCQFYDPNIYPPHNKI